jgi:ppGpp synthetase/RelA/SpoT-type nucleotidyltranferase
LHYVEPKFSLNEVNIAGRWLLDIEIPTIATANDLEKWVERYNKAIDIVNNWRASHARPLNTFYVTLNSRAKRIADGVIVAQRLKRLDSITKKLANLATMQLSQMQDIAGCRAVMPNLETVRKLQAQYRDTPGFSHELRAYKDYILEPKSSGYRGVHLMFRYKLRDPSAHEGQRVEIQIRTQLQHAWATAVEAAGTFTNQALKSSQGSEQWVRFFALMGSYIAVMENCPRVPGTPTDTVALRHEIRKLAANLNVIAMLRAYSATLREVPKAAKMKYYLLDLDPDREEVRLQSFTAAQSKQANDVYTETEKTILVGSNRQVVLVSVDSIQALRQAYPNYFLDTRIFVNIVRTAIEQEDIQDDLLGAED